MTTTDAPITVLVLKLLLRGRSPQWVADAAGLTAARVEQIARDHGWPDRDKVTAAIRAAGDQPPDLPKARGIAQPVRLPTPPAPPPREGRLEQLLTRAANHETKAVSKARGRALVEIDRLEKAVTTAEAKAAERQARQAERDATKARIRELEAELAKARAALRSDTARIRAWARDHGHDVPARGALPRRIVDAYLAAHTDPREAQEATA